MSLDTFEKELHGEELDSPRKTFKRGPPKEDEMKITQNYNVGKRKAIVKHMDKGEGKLYREASITSALNALQRPCLPH